MIDPAVLLAAIRAEPFDVELRRVYGDRLIELGDPRGELIQLQLARLERGATAAQTARERELLDRHATDWIGPLAAVADRFTIERGFLHTCSVPSHRKAYNIGRVVGDPAWSTVEVFAGPSPIFLHPVMRAMRSLTVSQADGLPELCIGRAVRPLRELVCLWRPPPEVYVSSALPELARLAVAGLAPDDLDLVGPRLGGHIRTLSVMYARIDHEIAHWITAANEWLEAPVLELVQPWRETMRWSLHRRAHGYDRVAIEATHGGEVLAALRLASPSLRRVDVTLGAPPGPALVAAVAAFPEHSITVRA